MSRPKQEEYTSFFSNYINLTTGNNYNELIKNHDEIICDFWTKIPFEKWMYSYADHKWSIKQLFQHVIDTERILAFRALSIARKEPHPLMSFNENEYAKNATAVHRNWKEMIAEWKAVRQSTNFLFNSFTEEDLKQKGIASNNPMSVNALSFIN